MTTYTILDARILDFVYRHIIPGSLETAIFFPQFDEGRCLQAGVSSGS
jgi:hypothetical protein